jgi:electron transport complex protein RnfG
MTTPVKNSLRTAAILIAFTLLGTALLAYTFSVTRQIIAASEERERLALINQVLPSTLYDNDLIKDAAELPPTEELGTSEPTLVYRARLKGEPSAMVFDVVAPDGYSGAIKMLVAIRASGEIAGVRVVSHNETPGLGDYIDIAKSKWITIFDGASLEKYAAADWKVKKDGGHFDYMSGATITPRAVVKAVYKALLYYRKDGSEILALPPHKQEVGK